jgi:hypothetical protein
MYISNLQFYQIICHFCVAHNTKNFISKICMLCGLHIDYVYIYIYNVWNLEVYLLLLFLKKGSLELRSQKHFPGLRGFYYLSTIINHQIEKRDGLSYGLCQSPPQNKQVRKSTSRGASCGFLLNSRSSSIHCPFCFIELQENGRPSAGQNYILLLYSDSYLFFKKLVNHMSFITCK